MQGLVFPTRLHPGVSPDRFPIVPGTARAIRTGRLGLNQTVRMQPADRSAEVAGAQAAGSLDIEPAYEQAAKRAARYLLTGKSTDKKVGLTRKPAELWVMPMADDEHPFHNLVLGYARRMAAESPDYPRLDENNDFLDRLHGMDDYAALVVELGRTAATEQTTH